MSWRPTRIDAQLPFEVDSRTSPILVETDAGPAVAKTLGNKAGPDALARELIGTKLASLVGLPTFDIAVIENDGIVPLTLLDGTVVPPGPLFAARWEEGETWSGTSIDLKRVENLDDIPRLVLFDCWVQNFDRFTRHGGPNLGNVFLSAERATSGYFRLLAIDHTHVFLARKIDADHVSGQHATDPSIYGLFEEFRPYLRRDLLLQAAGAIESLSADTIEALCGEVPLEWNTTQSTLTSLVDFLCQRAAWMPKFVEFELPVDGVQTGFPEGEEQ